MMMWEPRNPNKPATVFETYLVERRRLAERDGIAFCSLEDNDPVLSPMITGWPWIFVNGVFFKDKTFGLKLTPDEAYKFLPLIKQSGFSIKDPGDAFIRQGDIVFVYELKAEQITLSRQVNLKHWFRNYSLGFIKNWHADLYALMQKEGIFHE